MRGAISPSLAVLASLAWCTASGVAQATPAPVYGYAQVNVVEGLDFDEDSEHGAGPVHAEAGYYCWFHAGNSGCGGLPAAGPGAASAWADVSADAAAGSAALEVEAFNYGVPDPPYPQLPPYDYWGRASGYTYLRTTWEVTSTDPSLELGDPVELELSLLLEGVFDLHHDTDPDRGRGSAQMTFMLNYSADTVWLEEDFPLDEYLYLTQSGFADVLAGYGSAAIDFQGYGVSDVDGPVSLGETRAITVQVGDVITLEVAASVVVTIDNTNDAGLTDPIYIEGDFAHTFSQSLEATTPGALVTLVPEPGTALLMTIGLCGLAIFGRRR